MYVSKAFKNSVLFCDMLCKNGETMEETYENHKTDRLEACRLLAVCALAERIDGNGHDAHSVNTVDRRQSAG